MTIAEYVRFVNQESQCSTHEECFPDEVQEYDQGEGNKQLAESFSNNNPVRKRKLSDHKDTQRNPTSLHLQDLSSQWDYKLKKSLKLLQNDFRSNLADSRSFLEGIEILFVAIRKHVSGCFLGEGIQEDYNTLNRINLGLQKAQSHLLPSFFGLLCFLTGQRASKDDTQLILTSGWNFLKHHLNHWYKIGPNQIANLKNGHVSGNYNDYVDPIVTLRYLMSLRPKSAMSTLPMFGLIQGWILLNGGSPMSPEIIYRTLLNALHEIYTKTKIKFSAGKQHKRKSCNELEIMMGLHSIHLGEISGIPGNDRIGHHVEPKSHSPYQHPAKKFESTKALRVLQNCSRNELGRRDALRYDISLWFKSTKEELCKRTSSRGATRFIIESGLERGEQSFLLSFLGVLVLIDSEVGGNSTHQELMERGWEFFKVHFDTWKNINEQQILSLQNPAKFVFHHDHRIPFETFAWLISLNMNTLISSNPIYGLVQRWLEWQHSLHRSIDVDYSKLDNTLRDIHKKIIQTHMQQYSNKAFSFFDLKKILVNDQEVGPAEESKTSH